jgi:threonine synthase
MDILISSNFERMLFEMCSRDSIAVAGWMEELSRDGAYAVDAQTHARLRDHIWGGWENEAETMLEIRRCWREKGYLLDPHTATAAAVLGKYRASTGDTRPCVIAATASPYKFARAVAAALFGNTPAVNAAASDRTPDGELQLCRMLEEYTGLPMPVEIAELAALPVRHTARCAPDEMLDTLVNVIKGAS